MNKALSAMPEPLKFLFNCLYAAFIGTAILSGAVLLSAFLLTYTEDPDGFYTMCIIGAKIICGIISGIVAIRKNRRYALFCGIVSSLFIMAILFAVSFFVPQCNVTSSWWQAMIIPIFAILGAVMSNTAK
ncbi:MAG: TIGR04086 family membrane protein [Clostridia bacterium]|nr:TIGR04086 family membrane protein [Clostridia bacterium]